jgi:hypothetical protein
MEPKHLKNLENTSKMREERFRHYIKNLRQTDILEEICIQLFRIAESLNSIEVRKRYK